MGTYGNYGIFLIMGPKPQTLNPKPWELWYIPYYG